MTFRGVVCGLLGALTALFLALAGLTALLREHLEARCEETIAVAGRTSSPRTSRGPTVGS